MEGNKKTDYIGLVFFLTPVILILIYFIYTRYFIKKGSESSFKTKTKSNQSNDYAKAAPEKVHPVKTGHGWVVNERTFRQGKGPDIPASNKK